MLKYIKARARWVCGEQEWDWVLVIADKVVAESCRGWRYKKECVPIAQIVGRDLNVPVFTEGKDGVLKGVSKHGQNVFTKGSFASKGLPDVLDGVPDQGVRTSGGCGGVCSCNH